LGMTVNGILGSFRAASQSLFVVLQIWWPWRPVAP